MIAVSDIEVPDHLVALKREFIEIERGGPDPAGPEWKRMQDIALEIHRDPWWLECPNQYEARAAMTKAARAQLDG
jgi:hypothetical protein